MCADPKMNELSSDFNSAAIPFNNQFLSSIEVAESSRNTVSSLQREIAATRAGVFDEA